MSTNKCQRYLALIMVLALLGIVSSRPLAAACTNGPALDLTQTTYLFDFLANSDSNVRGKPQDLADFEYGVVVDGYTSSLLGGWTAPGLINTLGCRLMGGDWKLVWGPGVYEINPASGKTDNTAYVVYSASLDTYILAIAGTDPMAALDWLVEDLEVGPHFLVNWPYMATQPPVVAPKNAKQQQISLGTAKGLFYLLNNLVQSSKAPQPLTTLGQYLSQLKSKSPATRLIVTGHSLGGALSPTVANWARLTLAGTTWQGQIFAMPTAGPSPGNKTYAAAWDKAFPKTAVVTNPGNQIQSLNTLIYNQWDLVPHAWDKIATPSPVAMGNYFSGWSALRLLLPKAGYYTVNSQMGQLKFSADADSAALFTAVSLAKRAGYLAKMTGSSQRYQIEGSWPLSIIDNYTICSDPGPGSIPIQSEKAFLDALGQTHVWGYGNAFNLPTSMLLSVKATNPTLPPSTCP